MKNKEAILDAIKQTTRENGGKPLGSGRFETETGIKPHDWGRYWARFGDAQKEAGFTPNQLTGAHSEEFIIGKVIDLIRKYKKYPTLRELVVQRTTDKDLPSKGTFTRLGTKDQLATKIIEYCESRAGYEDVIDLCRPIREQFSKDIDQDSGGRQVLGEVYLFKSGRYYKIGKTNDTVRRGSELRIQLPEKMVLIHSIKTDDPSGVENYWHRRFESKRMNGEWFDLSSLDVKAFKKWRNIG